MSLDMAIRHGKEWRRRYYRSAAFDWSCRPHGGCPYCRGNRLYSRRRAEAAARQDEEQALADWLAIAEVSFTFWDNGADAAYDRQQAAPKSKEGNE